MTEDYLWTSFYPAAADALLKYQDKRKELLDWLYSALPEETAFLHDEKGERLTDIDPFTVFGILNRHISAAKKIRVAQTFKKFFDLKEEVPQNYRGIPPLSNENSMFFSFKDKEGSVKDDISNLWTLFAGALSDPDKIGPLFDEMVRHQYNIKFNITVGLYWIRPTQFFPLDAPSREFLLEHHIQIWKQVPPFAEYLQITDKVKKLLGSSKVAAKTFAELTRAISYKLHPEE